MTPCSSAILSKLSKARMESGGVGPGLREDFDRSNARFLVMGPVVEPNCMRDSQRPDCGIVDFGPMHGCMNHKSPSVGYREVDGSFADTVLPFGTDS